MDYPDLEQFKGKSHDDIAARLEDFGYHNAGDDFFVLPDSGHMIKIADNAPAVKRFADLCMDNAGNPFLPEIYEQFTVNDNTHLIVLEPLHTPSGERTLYGICRAISTFISGDENHEGVHEMLMQQEPKLVEAAKAIVGCLADHLYDKDGCYYYNARPNNVWIRDAENGHHQPVFRNPLRPAALTPKIEAQVQRLCERFDVTFPDRPDDLAAPDRDHAASQQQKGNGKPPPSAFGMC